MTLDAAASTATDEQVSDQTTDTGEETHGLEGLAELIDQTDETSSDTSSSDTSSDTTTSAATQQTEPPPPPELPADVKARLARLEELERNQRVQTVLADDARQKEADRQQLLKEQAETRALNRGLRELGARAAKLEEIGTPEALDQAELLRDQALQALNEFNQAKAEERVYNKIRSEDQRRTQNQQIFNAEVQKFMTDSRLEDLRDERLAQEATYRWFNGEPPDQIIADLRYKRDFFTGKTQQRQQAKSTADRARAAAGMEAPTGKSPDGKTDPYDRLTTDKTIRSGLEQILLS